MDRRAGGFVRRTGIATSKEKPASRTVALAAAVLLALLCALLVVDVVRLPSRYVFPRPVRVGDSFPAAADTVGRNRMLSVMVGLAAREAAGGRVEQLTVPTDLASVNIADKDGASAADVFGGVAQPALDARLFGPLVRSRVAAAEYDFVLSAAKLATLDEQGALRSYPRGVLAVVSPEATAESAGRVVLMTDATRERLYLVPRSLVGGL